MLGAPKQSFIAIGAGMISALAAMAFFNTSIFAALFIYLAPLPLYLVGLSHHAKFTTIAALSGFIVAGLIGGEVFAGLYAMIHALPSWLVIRQSMMCKIDQQNTTDPQAPIITEWAGSGQILASLTALGAAMLTFAAILTINQGGLLTFIEAKLNASFQLMAPNMAMQLQTDTIAMVVNVFPGAIGVSWILMGVANAVIAQGILTKNTKNLRPTPDYTNIVLPLWLTWLLVGSAGLALFGSFFGNSGFEYFGQNLAMIIAAPFFLSGTAIAHQFSRQVRHGQAFLTIFYVMLIIFGWIALIIALLGIIDQWTGFSQKLLEAHKNTTNNE